MKRRIPNPEYESKIAIMSVKQQDWYRLQYECSIGEATWDEVNEAEKKFNDAYNDLCQTPMTLEVEEDDEQTVKQ